jgi:signal transduction histidine kinase
MQTSSPPARNVPGLFAPLHQRRVAERYAIAIACAVLAILTRALMEPVLGHSSFYVTVYIAVVYTALVCGMGPAILTAIVSTAGVLYWFVDPRTTFLISDRRDIHSLIACIAVCPVLIALGEMNRRKRLEIAQARDQLEKRVQERTAALSEALTNLESQIKDRQSAEQQLRRLSVHLMTVQDEERRRIARDLHDSAGQTLAAIKMTLAMFSQSESDPERARLLLDDLGALTDEALQEIRTTSYLLHPPLLDEAGFASAARWFVDGFAKRSGVRVQCDFPEKIERLPVNVEVALFRLLQEALTNVHRHSGASLVKLNVYSNGNGLSFQVQDNGCGIPEQHLKRLSQSDGNSGVGLAGMRERIRELGGEMTIQSDNHGTTVMFALPKEMALGAAHHSDASAA